jgi:hypothetical protein
MRTSKMRKLQKLKDSDSTSDKQPEQLLAAGPITECRKLSVAGPLVPSYFTRRNFLSGASLRPPLVPLSAIFHRASVTPTRSFVTSLATKFLVCSD